MKNNLGFRGWFYFRHGFMTYFAFILAAINTLTVTYFLAVDNYPVLNIMFPSFEIYILLITLIGTPLLMLIGYAHFKKTQAFRSEFEVYIESHPYHARDLANREMSLQLNLKVIELLLKISKNYNVDEKDLGKIRKLQDGISKIVGERTLENKMDVTYAKNSIKKS